VSALAIALLTPTAQSAADYAARLAGAATTVSLHAPRAPAITVTGTLSDETPAVGALFLVSSAGLGKHFCTASVVDSPRGDLVITAAHCVSGKRPGQIAFVPGYHDGDEPYGVWFVTQVVVDTQWRRSQNPEHDVAFLVLQRHDGTTGVQKLTGGERLGTGWAARVLYTSSATRTRRGGRSSVPRGPARSGRIRCGSTVAATPAAPAAARSWPGGTPPAGAPSSA